MMECVIVEIPRFRIYYKRACKVLHNALRDIGKTVFLLPLPEKCRHHVKHFLLGNLTYYEFLDRILQNGTGEVLWRYYDNIKPVLMFMKNMLLDKIHDVICYKDNMTLNYEIDKLIKIISLTMKYRLFNSLKVKEWKSYIKELVKIQNKELSQLVKRTASLSRESNVTLLVEKGGNFIKRGLEKLGVKCTLYEVGPYFMTPLEKMIKLFLLDELNYNTLKQCVEEYVEFIYDYVMCYDDVNHAYIKWVYDKYGIELG